MENESAIIVAPRGRTLQTATIFSAVQKFGVVLQRKLLVVVGQKLDRN
jgi:hypothetical protein